jgi:hypothetical protein
MQSRFSCFLIGIICFASSFVSGQKPQLPTAPGNGGDFDGHRLGDKGSDRRLW